MLLNYSTFRYYSLLLSDPKYKAKYGKVLKILTPKQILQRSPVAFAQVETGNTSENLLNKIRQVIYSLYRAKEITENVCHNRMISINI